MPATLLLLATALPALQAPAPEAQAILEAARAKGKSVMEARTAFMKAGGNSLDLALGSDWYFQTSFPFARFRHKRSPETSPT